MTIPLDVIALANVPWWKHLPAVNAGLNATSAILLLAAFVMIKRRNFTAHAALVISAFAASSVFLALYGLEHWYKYQNHETVTRFPQGRLHSTYLIILISHTILAVVILPLIFASFFLAWRRRWVMHHKVSSITFPLWMYVSVTGVAVYWLLYRVAPTLPH